MTEAPTGDFAPLHAAMKRYVDANLLPGLSGAVLVGREVVDQHCVGWADVENGVPLQTDSLFRVFSNTKLVTSCAVMLLVEEGRLALDDPIERYLPQLGERRVLRPGATRIDDTEPAVRSITVRHLLSHSSGLSYGLLDPGTPIFQAYTAAQVLSAKSTLAQMIDRLAPLPLTFQPGTNWEYSVATDVLSRLVEVVDGRTFGDAIAARILKPLGMSDTGFVVPAGDRGRLVALYTGADLMQPMKPGLVRADHLPYPGAYLEPAARQSGGGGLISTLPDMIRLIQALLPGGPTLLRPQTLAMLMRNQLGDDIWVGFPMLGRFPGKGHGLGGAVTVSPSANESPAAVDEFWWGGIAGTQWWISPRNNLAAVVMTQRHMAFWHPFALELKRLTYQAAASPR